MTTISKLPPEPGSVPDLSHGLQDPFEAVMPDTGEQFTPEVNEEEDEEYGDD